MSAASAGRLAPEGALEHASALLAHARTMAMCPENRDDVIGIAMQMLASQANTEGATPTDVILGFAKGLGSVLALIGLKDIDGLSPILDGAVADYFGKSQRALAGIQRGGGRA